MRYLHTMVRVSNLEASLRFYCDGLGYKEVRRKEDEKARFTLVFLCADEDWDLAPATDEKRGAPHIELTYNWPDENGTSEVLSGGRNFGHIAVEVDDIYALCQKLMDMGYDINRAPRDGNMAFVKCPDGISFELLQKKPALAPQEPWVSMPNKGSW